MLMSCNNCCITFDEDDREELVDHEEIDDRHDRGLVRLTYTVFVCPKCASDDLDYVDDTESEEIDYAFRNAIEVAARGLMEDCVADLSMDQLAVRMGGAHA